MEKLGYRRNQYGELQPENYSYQIWVNAKELVRQAVKSKKIRMSYDTIEFNRRGRADGYAMHHEIYDIHPDPLRVLLCVRETEGSKYGVRTTSKNYYIIKKYGRGVQVRYANKSIAAKAAKNADCELGCAINVVEGKSKLKIARACPDGIAYKKLAIGNDGRLYSIYDGSPWRLGQERFDRAMRDHNGGLYVYETLSEAKDAVYPSESVMADADKIIVKMRVAGNYCRYGNKLAFSHATPINVEYICN